MCVVGFRGFITVLLFTVYLVRCQQSVGKYKTSITSITQCEMRNTLKSSCQNMLMLETYKEDGKKKIRGNYTVQCNKGPLKANIRSYFQRGGGNATAGSYYLLHQFQKMPCTHMVLEAIYVAANLNVNTNNCTFVKGKYDFTGIEADAIVHRAVGVFPYGRYRVQVEVFVSDGVVSCFDVGLLAEPLSSQKA